MKLVAIVFLACAFGANAIDNNTAMPAGMDAPASNAIAVTPSDSTDLASLSRALYVGTGGNVYVNVAGGQSNVPFLNVPGGSVLSIRVSRVLLTNTSASNIVELW